MRPSPFPLSPTFTVSPVQRFESIIHKIDQIASPPNMMPVVCLTKNAFPILTCCIDFDDSPSSSELCLPVLAGSTYGHGRVIVFSQVDFLHPGVLRLKGTADLFQSCLKWVSSGDDYIAYVALYGFSPDASAMIRGSLRELGLTSDSVRDPNFFGIHTLAIASDLRVDDGLAAQLLHFVEDGGALMVFYSHPADGAPLTIAVNRLLISFGLGFSHCLLRENAGRPDVLAVPPSYTAVREAHFIPICGHFRALLKQGNTDPSVLDDLVAVLRYYVMVCDASCAAALHDILVASWDFLTRTGYRVDGLFCPNLRHGIIVVLLQDIYTKLPITDVDRLPDHEVFPGRTGDGVAMGDFEIALPIKDTLWISTGLWLPAGVQGVVECAELFCEIGIQIGSHSAPLLNSIGPWKRWPSVVLVYQMEHKREVVGSPFGGIVYVTPIVTEVQEMIYNRFVFRNFCSHPRYVHTDIGIWEQTRDIDVPWGEIDIGSLIFTLPSAEMRKVKDFDRLKTIYDRLTLSITHFLSYDPEKPYRIVFDSDVTGGADDDVEPGVEYPATFLLEHIHDIVIDLSQPNAPLFQAIRSLALLSIRVDCFDPSTEAALAAVAAALAFDNLFDHFDPFAAELPNLPPLFPQFWEIEAACPGVFSKTLAIFQSADYAPMDTPDDMWVEFVRELCRCGQCNYTKLLEQTKPVPLNISVSLQGLPLLKATRSGPF